VTEEVLDAFETEALGQGSPDDVFVTPGLYGLNLFMTFK
jgi:hypothetical protein